MNHVVEEINAILGNDISGSDDLAHYGMPRRSGRYPWGSGDDPYQHDSKDFLGRVEELRKQNITYTDPKTGKTYSGDTAIAKNMGLSTSQFRTELGLATNERRMLSIARAKSLKEDGLNETEIGRRMGVNESTVRGWLKNNKVDTKYKEAQNTADFLKERLNEVAKDGKVGIDVGTAVELELGVSKEKLKQSLYLLEREGYAVYAGRIPQVTNRNQQTTQKVLCLPGTEHKEIYDYDKIGTIKEYKSHDNGITFDKIQYPKSMDSNRLMIRYAEDGGVDRDGIVEIRRGVKDLSLGDSRYSQVRILVDGTHYIKGMAVYSDDMPDGVDVIFNTNKGKNKSKMEVLKGIKADSDNPFGSLIKSQSYYIDDDGNRQLSLINKRADEGDWSEWKDALPSQFLAKQSQSLAKQQLSLAKADAMAEYESIMEINNPTIRKHYLREFADKCDGAAVNLQAAALPGQKYRVIIPINTLKDTEVYAPQYKDGTKLALVRYPHGGIYEIPILTVNNKNALGKKIIPADNIDAIGITKSVADRLSGADFDGDTVMCIPTHDPKGRVKIANRDNLPGLIGFEGKDKYGAHEVKEDADGTKHYFRNGKEYRIMSNTGTQMGVISNLITDMTLAGATDDELAAAVRHSMVVIDAEKHKLDYKQSEIDNNVAALHKKYQGKSTGGASTIISRAKGQTSVLKRQGSPKVNMKDSPDYDPTRPEGALIWKTADDLTYEVSKVNKKTGEITTKTITKTQKSKKMMEVDDAYDLVSDYRHPMEIIYADYANSMKALANKSRKEMMTTKDVEFSKAAKDTYRDEYNSLMNKLDEAQKNHIKERAALRKANVEVNNKKAVAEEAGDELSTKDLGKLRQQAITKYRAEVGTVRRKDRYIPITDREWEAIQAGAISKTKLEQILNNTDPDDLRERATPRSSKTISQATINRMKAYKASGLTTSQIASALNLSPSTVSKYMKGGA